MSRTGPGLPAQGPALSDVCRLWSHLTTEWVTDLEIKLNPVHHTDGTCGILLSVTSTRFLGGGGGTYDHVWAQRVFSGVDYKGSYNQLYDLLIVAYREIERELMAEKPQPVV